MTPKETRPVVVGTDGTAQALRAVRVAARHAAAYEADLRIVHVTDPSRWSPRPRQPGIDPVVHRLLDDAETVARNEEPALRVQTRHVPGRTRGTLLAESATACLLAIGHHGLGDRTGQLLGSLDSRLAGRPSCPLLVVRHLGDRGGPVVVTVDTAPDSDRVLRAAFREAQLLRRPLRVVHAWHVPVPALAGGPAVYGYELVEATEQQTVQQQAAGVGRDFPDVRFSAEARFGLRKATLWDATEGASLVVLGTPGPARLRTHSHRPSPVGTLHHAMCPVLLVPTATGN